MDKNDFDDGDEMMWQIALPLKASCDEWMILITIMVIRQFDKLLSNWRPHAIEKIYIKKNDHDKNDDEDGDDYDEMSCTPIKGLM